MLKKLQQLLFYSIILFLPTQLGKHFWPSWSYVSGLRIDYLSPTIYFTDVLIIILLALWVFEKSQITNHKSQIKSKISKYKHFVFWNFKNWNLFGAWNLKIGIFLFLLVGIFLSKNPMAGFYGLLKLAEFIFFGWYVARIIKSKKDFALLVLILSFGVCFESLLSIFQYINQSSINGILYFFGERTFTSLTPGIANTSIDGKLILRPYGTFPHPNVLAGYLVIVMTLIISNFQFSIFNQSSKMKKLIFICSIIIGSVALFLTMSRVAIILWIAIISLFIFKNLKLRIFVGTIFIAVILFSFFLLRFRFASLSLTEESFTRRVELINTSLAMVKDHLLYGVGLGNFLSSLPYFQKNNFDSLFLSIQPVHNIFFLVAAETGIVGIIFFTWFLIKTYRRIVNHESGIKRKNIFIHNSCFLLLASMILLGFFDHYFLTIQQGQLLFSLVLGLCWSKVNWQNNV